MSMDATLPSLRDRDGPISRELMVRWKENKLNCVRIREVYRMKREREVETVKQTDRQTVKQTD